MTFKCSDPVLTHGMLAFYVPEWGNSNSDWMMMSHVEGLLTVSRRLTTYGMVQPAYVRWEHLLGWACIHPRGRLLGL